MSGGGREVAFAEASLENFTPIENVAADIRSPRREPDAATGTFTVDCGTNGNREFSPDNPVARPGISNGAEHLHDFVGNLAINANTSDEALAAAGTTCRNGDRPSYFWPVVRIDRSVRADSKAEATRALAATRPSLSCPRVADRLPAVPATAMASVQRGLAELDRQLAAGNARLVASRGRVDLQLNTSVIRSLRAERAATITRISAAIDQAGGQPTAMVSLVECEVSYDGMHAGHGPATGSARDAASPTGTLPHRP
ncbi:hypothetical protein KBX37_20485 [Micromonospora sp. U56]|uniref:hypothetical protein n=1 Tax=Micromonospora sp. U56 TaxID=2824900 RepID=UPI001B37004C|nr:hypothetical protein [Micromonospora sp. U56]MBQ0895450.1 hypothetical protein [Micromonospora sp. U56]